MTMPPHRVRYVAIALSAACLLIASGAWIGRGALAQEPESLPTYGVAIHQGECTTPAIDASFDLGMAHPYGADPEDDANDATLAPTASGETVWTIDETIDSSFGVLLEELPHLVAIFDNSADPAAMIACGEIGGIVDDGRLAVGIRPMNDSSVAGIAVLDEDDTGILGLGDNEVNVRVYVLDELATSAGSPPSDPTPATGDMDAPTPTAPSATQPPAGAATPADGQAGAATQTELTVEMGDLYFEPAEFTVPADTDVTITLPNNGAAVHNFVVDGKNNPSDPGVFSGDVPPGDTATVTLNLPAGDWYFYCSIPGHEAAGMFGTIHAVQQ